MLKTYVRFMDIAARPITNGAMQITGRY